MGRRRARREQAGSRGEPALLAACYRRSLELAATNGIRTVAFPSISTGVYGYPIELAAEVAVTAVRESLREVASLHEVIYCCFSPADLLVYQRLLAEAAR